MKAFTELYKQIEETTRTNQKVEILVAYFQNASKEDIVLAVGIILGKNIKRVMKTTQIKELAAHLANLPFWLFDESYHIVGDLAETIALVLPPSTQRIEYSLSEHIDIILSAKKQPLAIQEDIISNHWFSIPENQRLVFNKLMMGSFRFGVSKQLIIKALSIFLNTDPNLIAQSLMGDWSPETITFDELFSLDKDLINKDYQPFPFYLASPIDVPVQDLGDLNDWQIEHKFDGIRGQIITRNQTLFIWSRGEELITDKFPEFENLIHILPNGTVLDGEIIPWKDHQPLPFAVMQTRISRKNISKASLQTAPIVMVCYDLLEHQGKDIRALPLAERRVILETLIDSLPVSSNLIIAKTFDVTSWDAVSEIRQEATQNCFEGVMLKRKSSTYEVGRKRGNWWKWKVDPLTIDGVLLYAQSGHGRRAGLYTDFTFAVWDGTALVPFCKAYSGLTNAEIEKLDSWIRKNTIEKFGPVRSVKPFYVFEIAFEGIQNSTRHKSGIALRFPRILRWRSDKQVMDANTLTDLQDLLKLQNG